ncbi:MAG TPA: isoprenylcysteine carboxylmethyltransferase family protein [Hyphomicrobiaceae bacterium]|nr:isoprenylcysteine carboxylmethyltransferase family protein [Hyphomicrobiaceae bacterium]
MNYDIAQRPTPFPWPPVLIAGALAGGWLLGRAYPVAWPGLDDAAARAVGIGLGLAGLVLFAWAAITLRRRETTILPNKGADHLVTDGPFRFRRNPIYLADVLILFGLAELTKNLWLAIFAVLFAVLVTWLAIIPEERHLEAKFGDAYRDYKAKTRRWI